MVGIMNAMAGMAGRSVRIPFLSVFSVTPSASGNAELSFLNNGQAQANSTSETDLQSPWVIPQSGMAGFDIRATKTGGPGTPTGSALATWLNLGTARSWAISTTSGNASNVVLTIEIRDAVSLAVLATATGVTISSDSLV